MKLYYAPGACSLSPHIVAEEGGIPLELEKVDLRSHTTETGQDYRQINPKGYVPTLRLDSGDFLTEGPAIVQYLADEIPGSPLAPPNGTIERYKLQSWLNFISTEIHKTYGPFFGGTDAEKAKASERIAMRYAQAEKELGDKVYLTGDTFSVADAYMFVTLRWAEKFGVETPPKLRALRERIASRPAVQAALKAEGLS
jgi:glutathione S-transferase